MQLDAEKSKAFFASRTALWNILGIVTAWFVSWRFPKFRESVCNNQEISVTIGLLLFTAFCSVNLFLRKITSCRIGAALLALFVLSGCAGIPQKLDTDIYYRRDMPFCVGSFGCFDGMTVLPKQSSYAFEVAPKGDADIDLMIVTTCHRNKSYEKTSSGWFIFQKKNRFRYTYAPNPQIEGDGDCSLVFNTFEKNMGRHAWAVILFEDPKYQLPMTVYCDGDVTQAKGVAGCQSKEGLKQGLEFTERVMIEPDKGCPLPGRNGGKVYEFPIKYKECGYTIRGESGRIGTLFTVGYRGELVRNAGGQQ
jgi:hypothetical protein